MFICYVAVLAVLALILAVCNNTTCFCFSTVFRYQVSHLDVEEDVVVLMLVDVSQSSGVRLIFGQRADPAPLMVVKNSLK